MKRNHILRFAVVAVSVLLLGAVTVETVDQFLIEPRTVSTWGELVDDYLDYRLRWGPISPPILYADVIDKVAADDWSFLVKDWAFKFSDGIYYVPQKSKLSKLKLPVHVRIYEDIQRGDIVILSSADGETFHGEALFDAPEFLPYEEGFPLARYAFDELAPRRVVYEIILKPEADAWTDLVLNARSTPASAEAVVWLDSPEMMMMSVPPENTNDLWIGTEAVSNGLNLWIYAPAGVTNVELYTSTDLVSNVWTQADVLSMAETNMVSWAVPTNEPVAFFRAGNANLDSDGDGLSDAMEDWVCLTNPQTPDSDLDGYSDGSSFPAGYAGTALGYNDAFPEDATEWMDTDGDGAGNNSDPDDDGDGIPDDRDPDPLDPEVPALGEPFTLADELWIHDINTGAEQHVFNLPSGFSVLGGCPVGLRGNDGAQDYFICSLISTNIFIMPTGSKSIGTYKGRTDLNLQDANGVWYLNCPVLLTEKVTSITRFYPALPVSGDFVCMNGSMFIDYEASSPTDAVIIQDGTVRAVSVGIAGTNFAYEGTCTGVETWVYASFGGSTCWQKVDQGEPFSFSGFGTGSTVTIEAQDLSSYSFDPSWGWGTLVNSAGGVKKVHLRASYINTTVYSLEEGEFGSHEAPPEAIVVDIEQENEVHSVEETSATLNLSDASYSPDGCVWTVSPEGLSGSGSGNTYTYNPNSSEPGIYTVRATSLSCDNAYDECTMTIASVELDESDLWFFRSEGYGLPLTVTPSSASDLLNVFVSGFDGVHWTAVYNSPLKKIDCSNLILESELAGWLDEQELSISAEVDSVANHWSWTKKLKLKKRLDGMWDDAKQDAISTINNAVSPADDIKSLVENSLVNISSLDSQGLVHYIQPDAINSAANFAYDGISAWWANFVGTYIWSDVPSSELHDKVTKESWTWNWDVNAEINFSGGSVSLDPGFDDVVQWIDSISDTGFSSETFVFENAMIGTSVTADGETANADIEARMNAFLRYANETILDVETGETAEGRIEYGIGISLHIWF